MFKVSANTHRTVVIVISLLTAITAYLASNGDLWGMDPTMAASIGGAVNLIITILRHVTDTPANYIVENPVFTPPPATAPTAAPTVTTNIPVTPSEPPDERGAA